MANGICGENLIWKLKDGTLIISDKGDMEDYGWIFGKAPWRKYWQSLKKVIIEHGVTSIGEEAFTNCENLTEIIIPTSVTIIKPFSFRGCKRLSSITIPDSVKTIGLRAFIGCAGLTEITIPASVTSIGEGLFIGCTSLKRIYYPSGRGFAKKLLRDNNTELIPYDTIPPADKATSQAVVESLQWKVEDRTLTVSGVCEIKDYSREKPPWDDWLDGIQKIVVKDGVEKISANAFIDCRRLELLTIPASVKTIGDFAFNFSFCGNGLANDGKNVFWSLEDGILKIKKIPPRRSTPTFL